MVTPILSYLYTINPFKMQMLEHIRQYYTDEKGGALYAVIAGFLFILISTFLWLRFSENPLSKGIATGFIFIGALLLVMSVATSVYNNKKIEGTKELRSASDLSLQQSEISRMEKVMNVTFKYAFISFTLLMLVALSIILVSKNYYWKGIGISLMLLVALTIISDSFSMQRNKAYQQKILSLTF